MALKHLGESADFHVGSIASLFPHEENENALFSAATGKPLARSWLHCERVLPEARPRKEEGAVTVRDLLGQGFRGRDVRFFLLGTHYRKPLAYNAANLKAVAAARARLDHFLERLTLITGEGSPQPPLEERLFRLKKEFIAALDDDLNISKALSAIFALVGDLNADIDRGRLGHGDAGAILARLEELDEVLGVMTLPHHRRDAEVEALLGLREKARQRKDWAEADRIRQDLAAQGVEVIDTPGGSRWKRRGE